MVQYVEAFAARGKQTNRTTPETSQQLRMQNRLWSGRGGFFERRIVNDLFAHSCMQYSRITTHNPTRNEQREWINRTNSILFLCGKTIRRAGLAFHMYVYNRCAMTLQPSEFYFVLRSSYIREPSNIHKSMFFHLGIITELVPLHLTFVEGSVIF